MDPRRGKKKNRKTEMCKKREKEKNKMRKDKNRLQGSTAGYRSM